MRKKYGEVLNKLSTEQKAERVDAVFLRQSTGEVMDNLDPLVDVLLSLMIQEWKKDDESYEAMCEKNSENGKKGGRPRRDWENSQKPNGFSENPQKANGFFENPQKAKKADMIGCDMIGCDKEINTPPISPSKKGVVKDIPSTHDLLVEFEKHPDVVEGYGGLDGVRQWLDYKQRKKGRAYKTSSGFIQQMKIILPIIQHGLPRDDLPSRFEFAVNQAMENERKTIYWTDKTESEYQDFKCM